VILSDHGRGVGLDKVVLHKLLEVEVGELILLVNLQELSELGVRVNLAAVALVLETVGLDVGVNLAAHVRARHLRANRLPEEGGQLVADASGLDEARGLAVAIVAALLGRKLLGILHLARDRLLKGLEIVLDRGEEADELLELGVELSHLDRERRGVGDHRIRRGGGRGSGRSGGRRRSGLGNALSRRLGSGGGSGGHGSRGGGSNLIGGSLSSSNHCGLLYITNVSRF